MSGTQYRPACVMRTSPGFIHCRSLSQPVSVEAEKISTNWSMLNGSRSSRAFWLISILRPLKGLV